jgi:hypothetical protein
MRPSISRSIRAKDENDNTGWNHFGRVMGRRVTAASSTSTSMRGSNTKGRLAERTIPSAVLGVRTDRSCRAPIRRKCADLQRLTQSGPLLRNGGRIDLSMNSLNTWCCCSLTSSPSSTPEEGRQRKCARTEGRKRCCLWSVHHHPIMSGATAGSQPERHSGYIPNCYGRTGATRVWRRQAAALRGGSWAGQCHLADRIAVISPVVTVRDQHSHAALNQRQDAQLLLMRSRAKRDASSTSMTRTPVALDAV